MDTFKFSDFSLDLDSIVKYCCISENCENTTKNNNEFRQQEISNNYQLNDDNNLILAEKIVHEVITPQDAPLYDPFKTDLVKGLLNVLLDEKELDDDGKTKFSMPGIVILQTFLDYGFLKIKE